MTKYTLEDCTKIAGSRGGKCLSDEYINNRTYMSRICSNNHEWSSQFSNIKIHGAENVLTQREANHYVLRYIRLR